MKRTKYASLTAAVRVEVAPIRAEVGRAFNETRLAVLGIIVPIGLTVGFGVSGPWWVRVAAGVGSVLIFGGLIRVGRQPVMVTMHWLTDA
jgi:hypothetical protein